MLDINFLLIVFQIIILTSLIFRESRKLHRNYILIFLVLSYIILVSLQSLWLHFEFKKFNYSTISVVGNSFSYNSYLKTNLLFFVAVLLFSFTVIITDKLRLFKIKYHDKIEFYLPGFGYFIIIIWTLFFSALLINKIGGFDSAVNNPGQMIEGQTFYILMLSLAKWPLLLKLNFKFKPNIIDFLLFSFYLLIILFNSRFLTSFAIIQLFFVYHYRIKSIEVRKILLLGIPLFLIFIVFGIYRDFSYRFDTVGLNEALSQYANVKDEFSIVDWFFSANVEAFSGTAGIIHYSINNSNFNLDYGLSEFSNLLNLIPNKLRNSPHSIIKEINDYLISVYPYRGGSVVPSGFETSFGHFSYFGFFIYNIIIAFLAVYFHKSIINKKTNYLPVILSVHLLNSVRASFWGAFIFFGISEIITLTFFRFMFKKCKGNQI